MAYTKNPLILQVVQELTIEGEKLIKYAYNNKDWQNRLGNLHDSYGSAVYVNGVLYKNTIRYVGSEMSERTRSNNPQWFWNQERSFPDFRGNRYLPGDEIMVSGREEVMDFFSKYKPTNKKGVELVIVAAMWYANVLENGTSYGLSKKYKVISHCASLMQVLASKYRGFVSPITYF